MRAAIHCFVATVVGCCLALPSFAADAVQALPNAYQQTTFVANKAKYKPTLAVEKNFINAWGIAIRPKGAGGHFWITAKDASYEYVGDVSESLDKGLQTLHQDQLKIVTLPVGGNDKFSTSTVFSDSKENFVITQKIKNKPDVKAPAKFLFASDGGIISAWTERKLEDGTFDRSGEAIAVIDQSKEGAQFFGLAIDHDYTRLYAADFGSKPGIKVFNQTFELTGIAFENPFDENKNNQVDAGEYAPFNVQSMMTPEGKSHVFVTYAKTQACPEDAVKAGSCKTGDIFPGEEDVAKPGQGRLAEFDENGRLITVWDDAGMLSAPWGMAFAPNDFGALSGKLLVGNFGDGKIVAFDPQTHKAVDVMRDSKGKPMVIDKLWGLLFGNGESLGDANSLYFTAGPDDEKDGVFGRLRLAKK